MSIFVAWLFERRGRSDPYVECRRCGSDALVCDRRVSGVWLDQNRHLRHRV